MDTTPLLAVGDGARRGDPLLINVVAARFTVAGELVIITGDDAMVRWVDPLGAVRASRGGFGDGPGEFRDLVFVGSVGDSVVLWDGQLGRVSVLPPTPTGTRSFRLQGGDSATAPEFGYVPIGLLGAERLVLAGRRGARSREQSGLRRDSIPFATASLDGRIGASFALVPGAETVVVSTDQFVTMIPRPFGAQTAVTVEGDEVLVTVGDVDELRHYRPGSGLVRIDRLDRPRRLIAPAEFDQQGQRLGAQTAQFPKAVATAILGTMMAAGLPKVYPTYDRILTDADGNAWMREDIGTERGLDEARRWTILDKAGSWLGQVTTPRHFELHEVARDRILGVSREPNGGEVVQVLRLSR
ncbi:MAG: hypothetical protein ABI542_04290 [Gemmatimonadota bacterium]